MISTRCLIAPIALNLLLAWPTGAQDPPATRKSPVTTTYHGVSVKEDFRWLEDGTSLEVRQWSQQQNKWARDYLDQLAIAQRLRGELTELLSQESQSYAGLTYAGGRYVALRFQPPLQQPQLIVFDSLDAPERHGVIVDPNQIDATGATSIDWFRPSPDGKWMAVSLSRAGTERGDLTIFDIAAGRPKQNHEGETEDAIPYVNSGTAGGDLAWQGDSKGFYYTRHFRVRPGDLNDQEVYQHVYRHLLGDDPQADRYELGKGFPKIAEIQLDVDGPTQRVLATVQEGDGGRFAHYLRDAAEDWRQFSHFGDGVVQAVFGPDKDLYVVSQQRAPKGEIVRVSGGDLDVASGVTVVAESDKAIVTGGEAFWGETTVLPTRQGLFVLYQLGGPSEIHVFDEHGTPLPRPEQLPVSSVHGMLEIPGGIAFGNVSYVVPDAMYAYDAQTKATRRTAVALTSVVDLSRVGVIREFAESNDGTQVPVNVILPSDFEKGRPQPCLVYGYGGYAVNMTPAYNPALSVLLNHGVIYAVANLRGGSEFGKQWHEQGRLTKKQNVFDDFHAAVRMMSLKGYSTPEQTAIMGGSNGGLLMGATLTQHPQDIAVVISRVGIYDMLRNELTPNGKFNTAEYGSVEDQRNSRRCWRTRPTTTSRMESPTRRRSS